VRANNLTILAPGTFVRGDIYSEDLLVIEGGVEGNINGNRVLVKSSGWVHGNLFCSSLSIEPGGVVDGAMKVTSAISLPPGHPAPEALPDGSAALLLGGENGAAAEETPPPEEDGPKDEPPAKT